MKLRFLLFIHILTSFSLQGEQPDAAISFMIADLKYSQEHGVKICEVQNGISSTFKGDAFLNGDYGVICPNFISLMSQFSMEKWTVTNLFSSSQLKELIPKENGWIAKKSFKEILKDPAFIAAARKIPDDPSDISSYSAMLFVKKHQIQDPKEFRKKYPGILVIDAPTYPYWVDKFKMSKLFEKDDILSTFKPEFKLFDKKYSKTLSDQIITNLPADRYVIKPRGTFLGNGVIILEGKDLDRILKYILTKSKKLKNDPDKSYRYWYRDPFKSFVIEKFFASDPITVPHLNNNVYQPTMRVAFVLIYDQKSIDIQYLGNYWLTPFKSLDEEGSLNETHKTWVEPPHCSHVDQKIVDEVYRQLDIALPLLYEQMIHEKTKQ